MSLVPGLPVLARTVVTETITKQFPMPLHELIRNHNPFTEDHILRMFWL